MGLLGSNGRLGESGTSPVAVRPKFGVEGESMLCAKADLGESVDRPLCGAGEDRS